LVLVFGATGYTGRLVCEALQRRGVAFAIAGRSEEKLASLSDALGGVERARIDLADADSVRRAIEGRRIVCACAGPFVQVGEPVLATCARLGVHYVDTTGEQGFVALALARYRATAEASGACVVPAMAFEIAPADWGADVVAKRLGAPPEALDVCYMNRPAGGAAATTRGTKRSIVAVLASGDARQYVDGALEREAAAAHVRTFPLPDGRKLTAASFPSPEPLLVPSHTGARTVRTFMAMDAMSARAIHLARGFAPTLARLAAPLADRAIAGAPNGPDAKARAASTFAIYIEARAADRRERAWITGKDGYGLTAEIQAWAAERALAGAITARGVVAPSVAFPAPAAFEGLSALGIEIKRGGPEDRRG
jgi:short subunit dehydrogenase-like uncharacterized protein